MKVRAREINWDDLPDELRGFSKQDQTFLTVGKDYTVLAMSVFEGIWFVLICDDDGMAEFEPLHLFTQVSMDMPPEWICNFIGQGDLAFVMGPDFVARDLAAHTGMVDKNRSSVEALWRFYDVLLERERAESSS